MEEKNLRNELNHWFSQFDQRLLYAEEAISETIQVQDQDLEQIYNLQKAVLELQNSMNDMKRCMSIVIQTQGEIIKRTALSTKVINDVQGVTNNPA